MAQSKNRLNIEPIKEYLNITTDDLKNECFLKQKENIFFLVLNRKVNSITKQFVRQINDLLDKVENNNGPTALVTLGLNDKYFSTGLDLKEMFGKESNDIYYFILEVIKLYGRLQAFPVPCIAMINGFAIAGGGMLAFAHDYRVMRNDQGYIQMTEVELGMPLPPGMMATIRGKTGYSNEFRDLILIAKKFNGNECQKLGWVDLSVNPEQLFQETLKLAQSLAKWGDNKQNYKKLKEEMNKEAIDCCFNKQHAVGVRGEVSLSFNQPKL